MALLPASVFELCFVVVWVFCSSVPLCTALSGPCRVETVQKMCDVMRWRDLEVLKEKKGVAKILMINPVTFCPLADVCFLMSNHWTVN